jgi:hypothetical protein
MRFYIIYSIVHGKRLFIDWRCGGDDDHSPPPHSTPLLSLSGSFHITDRLNREEKRDIPQTQQERKKERRRKLASFIDKEHPG